METILAYLAVSFGIACGMYAMMVLWYEAYEDWAEYSENQKASKKELQRAKMKVEYWEQITTEDGYKID